MDNYNEPQDPRDLMACEAHGVKGMKAKPWRKEFKNAAALVKWANKNEAVIYATRQLP